MTKAPSDPWSQVLNEMQGPLDAIRAALALDIPPWVAFATALKVMPKEATQRERRYYEMVCALAVQVVSLEQKVESLKSREVN